MLAPAPNKTAQTICRHKNNMRTNVIIAMTKNIVTISEPKTLTLCHLKQFNPLPFTFIPFKFSPT